ncbi:MAG: SUMF1/EgtB/PvdO family nonheme iron enzyme [Salinivirgaceae bacterium]|nr:SUMF1/EgtB/PvdO family nonheme iron enzyme [Salinivirgaceae bacterium]
MNTGDIIDNHYELKHQLGRGSFGEVWLATDTYLGLDVALKFYVAMDDNGRQEFRDEYSKAFRLRHNNLLTPSYYGEWNGQPYLVLEYCPASAAAQLGRLDEPTLWRFIADVADGLAYMHSSNPTLVHQDIKPANILQKTDGHYAITDFGISVSLRSTMLRQSGREAASSVGGSIPYMGPELFGAKPVPIMASDVWALGVTIYEMATGELPFMAQGGIMQKNGAEVPELGDKWSAQLNYLLKRCLALNTWERPLASNILKYATNILDGINPCELKDGGNVSASPAYAPTKREVPTAQPMTNQFPNLKFSTDVDCQIYIDGTLRGEVVTEQIKMIPLRQGDYILKFVSLKNSADSYQTRFSMPNAEKLFDIQLKPIEIDRETKEREIAEKKRQLEEFIESLQMEEVDGGTFWMGAHSNKIKTGFLKSEPDTSIPNYDSSAEPDEWPVHQVEVSSFFIGKFPVTIKIWQTVMGNNPSRYTTPDLPIVSVSWNDCQEFIGKLNALTGKHFRLPTEAEWEYAARGGYRSKGYKYAGSDNADDVAWFEGNSSNERHIVGRKKPNELGLYDMSGNVLEWCQDWYGPYTKEDLQVNPTGPEKGQYRVIRGGCWCYSRMASRVSSRKTMFPGNTSENCGLRLAMSVESNE